MAMLRTLQKQEEPLTYCVQLFVLSYTFVWEKIGYYPEHTQQDGQSDTKVVCWSNWVVRHQLCLMRLCGSQR